MKSSHQQNLRRLPARLSGTGTSLSLKGASFSRIRMQLLLVSPKTTTLGTLSDFTLDHPSGTRVFSRDVAKDPSRPPNSQALLHAAVHPSELAESRNSIETSKQVRRMPRLEVARSRPTPADEPEWPLKSDKPLRASFGSGHVTRMSAEWKPSPARQRSLSRRRGHVGPARIDTTRTWSSETSTTDSAVEIPFNSAVGEGKQETLTSSVQDTLPGYTSDEAGAAREQLAQPCEHASRQPSALPESHVIPTGIGYPSAHPNALPVSNKLPVSNTHGVLFHSKHAASWTPKGPSSPLKDKIGMFESLSRQGSVAASVKSVGGNRQRSPLSPSRRDINKHSGSLNRTASRIKATLRKISVSWEWGHAKRLPASGKESASKCISPSDRVQDKVKGQAELQSATDSLDYGSSSRVKIRRFLSPASYLSDEEKPLPPVPRNSLRRNDRHTTSSMELSQPAGITRSANLASNQLVPAVTAPGSCRGRQCQHL